jgi:hypothetical protein
MQLTFRSARTADFPACCRMLAAFRGRYDSEVLRALPGIWAGLMAGKALSLTVFEDEDHSSEQRLLGFGTGMFVADACIAEMLAQPKPYLANRIYQSCLQGQPPALGYRALRQANASGGVNLLPLDFALAERAVFSLKALPLFAIVWEAFQFNFYGYRLNRIVQEVFGEDWRDFLLAAGLKVYTEFSSLPEPHPVLMGISRQDCLAHPGSRYTFFFTAPPPRFYFSCSEQELLSLALRGSSDQEVAEELGISTYTVKELWCNIFRRVEDAEPDWFPCKTPVSGRRGPEKRRYLLKYLAHHLEELRPWRKLGKKFRFQPE